MHARTPRRDVATSSYEFSLYRGQTATADDLSVHLDESGDKGIVGQSFPQSKFRNESDGFDSMTK